MATPALAHTVGAAGAGLVQGFAHPFTGLDHVLALVGLGLWSGQLAPRDTWRLALAFLTSAAVGFAIGAAGFPLPLVEFGIAGSVLLIGLLVLLAVTCRSATAITLAMLFGVLHGHAHGTELYAATSPYLYSTGFLAGMALLYGSGAASALVLSTHATRIGTWGARAVGAVIAATGAALVIG
jgi:urease accessory protein